jgi:hypothetical protein
VCEYVLGVPGLRAAVATAALAGVLAGGAAAAGAPDRASLALMPLPKAALGSAAAALPLDRDSGVVANTTAAENATESVSAKKLARLGRITGYALDYNDAGAAALRSGHGLIEVETSVELYANRAAAAAGFAFWRHDDADAAALMTRGLTFTVDAFDPGRLGADRFAYDGVVRVQGTRPIYDVDVQFRTGRLVADVDVTAADHAGARPLARSLAATLERRIAGVLSGRIAGPPVALPGKATAGPPPHGPELSTLTLKPGDLGSAKVVRQRYQVDEDLAPISEYDREMSPGGAFAYLDEEVALFHSPTEASYTLRFLGEAMASEQLVLRFGGLAGSDVASFRPRRVAVQAGDEARAVIATVKLKNGAVLDEGFVILRFGSTTELISVGMPLGGRILPSALTELATVAAARVSRGLHRSPVA